MRSIQRTGATLISARMVAAAVFAAITFVLGAQSAVAEESGSFRVLLSVVHDYTTMRTRPEAADRIPVLSSRAFSLTKKSTVLTASLTAMSAPSLQRATGGQPPSAFPHQTRRRRPATHTRQAGDCFRDPARSGMSNFGLPMVMSDCYHLEDCSA